MTYDYDAIVVGSGPNGLAAAIRLVQHGLSTLVLEGNSTFGGGVRTEELTLPGFRHDLGSAVHPLAFASPYFSSLPLENHGLAWVFPKIPLAHPVANGAAIALDRSVELTSSALGADAKHYRSLFGPLVSASSKLVREFLQPLLHLPRYPLTLGLFGVKAIQPATILARTVFSEQSARALFAGLAAHSFLPLSSPGSAAFGLVLGMLGHTTGWPFPRGGANEITSALINYFQKQGGQIRSGFWTTSLGELPSSKLVLLDLTPKQFLKIAGDQMPKSYRDALNRFRYGPGIFKIDYALSKPIPWRNEICLRAGTVHCGGSLQEVARSEFEVSRGKHPERPFILLSQPSLFDSNRAPAGRHVAWAYCHVPSASSIDMTGPIEAQLERFAPGFRDCVLARSTMNTRELQQVNPNLIYGSISGGANDLWHLLARPVLKLVPYRTPLQGVFLCSSSTPPGGGVHGMCGFHAANAALKYLRIIPNKLM